jgi:hypothetical protein
MKRFSCLCSALGLALGLVGPNQVHGQAACFVVEITMDRQAAPESVDQSAWAEREATSSVHPLGKVKALKNAPAPANPSPSDQARVKAFISGQSMAAYCGATRIVEGDE